MIEPGNGATMKNVPHAFQVGVVVERRENDNQWVEATWRPVEVLPDFAADDTLKALSEGQGWRRYLAGSLEIELFKRETDSYKINFSQAQPMVYVVLRPGEAEDEPDVIPFLATLSPYEAEDYAESGEMIIDAVPMPAVIASWAASFIEIYHVDQPFLKRKRTHKSANAVDNRGKHRRGLHHDR